MKYWREEDDIRNTDVQRKLDILAVERRVLYRANGGVSRTTVTDIGHHDCHSFYLAITKYYLVIIEYLYLVKTKRYS